MSAAPANAYGDDEKVGLAAALGLTAAGGKTSIAEGGGEIEASLLSSEAIRQAGRVTAALALSRAGSRPVAVLAHDETVNFTAGADVLNRMAELTGQLRKQVLQLGSAACAPKPPVSHEKALFSTKAQLGLPDLGAALATDTSIAPVKVSIDDRMLVEAVVLAGDGRGASGWAPADGELVIPGNTGDQFILPSEIVAIGKGNRALLAYRAMLALADGLSSCAAQPAKDAVASAMAYAKEINTPSDKTGMTPLGAAAQLAAVESKEGEPPYVLRVAVEKAGGTAITRSSIWYTLGVPGAATISTGLLTSFRLIDPVTGRSAATGFVRCVMAPININNVYSVVNSKADPYLLRNSQRGRFYCAYLAG